MDISELPVIFWKHLDFEDQKQALFGKHEDKELHSKLETNFEELQFRKNSLDLNFFKKASEDLKFANVRKSISEKKVGEKIKSAKKKTKNFSKKSSSSKEVSLKNFLLSGFGVSGLIALSKFEAQNLFGRNISCQDVASETDSNEKTGNFVSGFLPSISPEQIQKISALALMPVPNFAVVCPTCDPTSVGKIECAAIRRLYAFNITEGRMTLCFEPMEKNGEWTKFSNFNRSTLRRQSLQASQELETFNLESIQTKWRKISEDFQFKVHWHFKPKTGPLLKGSSEGCCNINDNGEWNDPQTVSNLFQDLLQGRICSDLETVIHNSIDRYFEEENHLRPKEMMGRNFSLFCQEGSDVNGDKNESSVNQIELFGRPYSFIGVYAGNSPLEGLRGLAASISSTFIPLLIPYYVQMGTNGDESNITDHIIEEAISNAMKCVSVALSTHQDTRIRQCGTSAVTAMWKGNFNNFNSGVKVYFGQCGGALAIVQKKANETFSYELVSSGFHNWYSEGERNRLPKEMRNEADSDRYCSMLLLSRSIGYYAAHFGTLLDAAYQNKVQSGSYNSLYHKLPGCDPEVATRIFNSETKKIVLMTDSIDAKNLLEQNGDFHDAEELLKKFRRCASEDATVLFASAEPNWTEPKMPDLKSAAIATISPVPIKEAQLSKEEETSFLKFLDRNFENFDIRSPSPGKLTIKIANLEIDLVDNFYKVPTPQTETAFAVMNSKAERKFKKSLSEELQSSVESTDASEMPLTAAKLVPVSESVVPVCGRTKQLFKEWQRHAMNNVFCLFHKTDPRTDSTNAQALLDHFKDFREIAPLSDSDILRF